MIKDNVCKGKWMDRRKKRIGIFCFYDKEGIVDKYVEYLLIELKKVIDELYIVVNGNVKDMGRILFRKYACKVYVRENKGFDAGAYKDVIINLIGVPKIKEFDELVLCNDTFFGPFIGFDTIFKRMEQQDADFWGLKYVNDSFFSHLQSYFLVFGEKILKENILFRYFNEKINAHTDDIADVYATFERGLFYKLRKEGYSYASYANSINCDDYRSGNYSIKIEGLPLLKKKVFDRKYYINDNVVQAIEIIKNCYDIELIKETLQRKYVNVALENKKNIQTILYTIPTMNVVEQDVIDFSKSVRYLYIYGTGVVATSIFFFFSNMGIKFEGFVISDGKEKRSLLKQDLQVLYMSEVNFKDEVGIIIALNPENSKQIQKSVEDIKNVLYLWEI